jgi:hypothetical protein
MSNQNLEQPLTHLETRKENSGYQLIAEQRREMFHNTPRRLTLINYRIYPL